MKHKKKLAFKDLKFIANYEQDIRQAEMVFDNGFYIKVNVRLFPSRSMLKKGAYSLGFYLPNVNERYYYYKRLKAKEVTQIMK